MCLGSSKREPRRSSRRSVSAAVDYLSALGMDNVRDHEMRLTATPSMRSASRFPDSLTIYRSPGRLDPRRRRVSFLFDGIHAHDMIRSSTKTVCACVPDITAPNPPVRRLGVPATSRASVYVYNDEADVDVLVEALAKAQKFFAI